MRSHEDKLVEIIKKQEGMDKKSYAYKELQRKLNKLENLELQWGAK